MYLPFYISEPGSRRLQCLQVFTVNVAKRLQSKRPQTRMVLAFQKLLDPPQLLSLSETEHHHLLATRIFTFWRLSESVGSCTELWVGDRW